MSRPTLELQRDTRWARHLDSLEFGAETAAWRTVSKPAGLHTGILACCALAAGAALLEIGASNAFAGRTLDAAMFAMLLGIAVGNAGVDADVLRPGARWIIRVVLPLGIMLMGAQLHVADLLGVGLRGLALSAGVVALSLAVLHAFARWRGRNDRPRSSAIPSAFSSPRIAWTSLWPPPICWLSSSGVGVGNGLECGLTR